MSPQVEYLEAIVTCKGNYYAPDFPLQLSNLYSGLEELVFKDQKKSIILKKVEPWNSIRVTLKMPADAARRLKQLYEQPDSILQTLGILAVHLEADNSLKNYNCDDNSIMNSLSLNTDLNSNNELVIPDKIESSNVLLSNEQSHQITLNKNSKLDNRIFNPSNYTSSGLVRLNEANDFTNPEFTNTLSHNILSIKNLVSVNQNIASSSPLLVNLLKSPGTRNTQISNSEGLSQSDNAYQMSKKRKRNQPKNPKRFKPSSDFAETGHNNLINQNKDNNFLINAKMLESEVLQNKHNLTGNSDNCVFKPNTNSSFSSLIKTNLISQTLLENSILDNISISNFATCLNTNMQTKTSDFDNSINSINSNMILNINNILRLAAPSTQSDARIISSEGLKTSAIDKSGDLTQGKEIMDDIFDLKTIKNLEASHRAKINDIFKPLLNGTSNLTSESSIGTILETALNKNVANILNGRISSHSQLSELTQNLNFHQNLSSSLSESQADEALAEKQPKIFNSNYMPNTKTLNGCLSTNHQTVCNSKQDEALFNKNLNLLLGNNVEDINEQPNQNSSFNLNNIMPVNLNGEIVTPSLQQVTAVLKSLQKLKVQRPQQIEDPHRAKSNLTVAKLLEQVEIAKNNRSSPINYVNINQKISNSIQSIPLTFSLPRMQNNNIFQSDRINKYNLLNDQSIFNSNKQNIFQSTLVSQRNTSDMFASVLNSSSTQSPLLDNYLTNCSAPSYSSNLTETVPSVLKNNCANKTPPVSPNLTLRINDQMKHGKEQIIFESSNEEFLKDLEIKKLDCTNFNYTACSNSNSLTTSKEFLNPDKHIPAKEAFCDEEGIKTMIASFYEAANLINNRKSADAISDFIGIELGADDEANINDIIEMKDYDEDIEKLVESMSSSIGDEDLMTENSRDDLVNNIRDKYSQFSEYASNTNSREDDIVELPEIRSEIKDQPSFSKQNSNTSLEFIKEVDDYKINETSDNNFSIDICSFKENIVTDLKSYNHNKNKYFFAHESVVKESLPQEAEEIFQKNTLDGCDLVNDKSEKIDTNSLLCAKVEQDESTNLIKKCEEIFDSGFGDDKNTQSEEMEVSFENQEENEAVNNIQMSDNDCFEDKSNIYISHSLLHDSNLSKNHFINDWSDGRRLKKKKDPCLADLGDHMPDSLTSKRMITRSSGKTKFLVVIDKSIEKNSLNSKNNISPRRSSRTCRHLNSEKQNLRSRSSILKSSKILNREDKPLEDVQIDNIEIQSNTINFEC